ncbi:GNAT family N-acetyltransferase [Roseovarius aestuarii]|uniref:FemAB family protein n=1 Tax=Roseovarius aestuarii TaxID=475083 RepID=A0A1X7BPS5_9RHOB|nr:GNAT family N-acetyltransferase [Roseovarius aestuarii]SMC11607.1 FemAB family protein [Roseovarius aestuarii]
MEFIRSDARDFPATPCALQQSAGYAHALRELGVQSETYVAKDGTCHIAKLHVLRRRIGPMNIAWLPRGPVWATDTPPEQRARLMRTLRKVGTTSTTWIISSETPQETRLFPHLVLMSPQYVAEIDLTADTETRLAAMHGKWRNRLRHAERSELHIRQRPFRSDRDLNVLVFEASQRKQRGYKALPPDFVLAWEKAGPKSSRLFTAMRGNTPLAHLLVLLHKPVATYHIGWSGAEGRRLSAHNLALWEAAAWLTGKGYLRFDLGNVDTQNAPGLARFKIGSGARIRPLGPTCLHLPHLPFGRRPRHDAA